jgi:hypothetical protein
MISNFSFVYILFTIFIVIIIIIIFLYCCYYCYYYFILLLLLLFYIIIIVIHPISIVFYDIIYDLGYRHLIRDDIPVPIIEKPNRYHENVLSDREVDDAIDYIRDRYQHHRSQPWYLQLWLNAPHGPWEIIHTGESLYNAKYNKTAKDWEATKCRYENRDYPLYDTRWYYKTMVSAMDLSIGRLLHVIKELQLEEETMIIFTSDNGNEMGAGTGGIFKEGKRSLLEGGIRVPTIIQWKSIIPSNSYSSYFAGHTDILPTILEAAQISRPFYASHPLFFDGISILPVLKKALPRPVILSDLLKPEYHIHHRIPGEDEIRQRFIQHYQEYFPTAISSTSHIHNNNHTVLGSPNMLGNHHNHNQQLQTATTTNIINNNNNNNNNNNQGGNVLTLPARPHYHHHHHRHLLDTPTTASVPSTPTTTTNTVHITSNRVYLWHKDTDPFRQGQERVQSGGYFENIKLLTSTNRFCIDRIFDLRHDPFEDNNVLKPPYNSLQQCKLTLSNIDANQFRSALSHGNLHIPDHFCQHSGGGGGAVSPGSANGGGGANVDNSNNNNNHISDQCKLKYINMIVLKAMIIVRKLLPFVRDGNKGHQDYMQHRIDQATCDIPRVSQIAPMLYVHDQPPNHDTCHDQKFGCSFPEY